MKKTLELLAIIAVMAYLVVGSIDILLPEPEQKQFIMIDGIAINPDHIVSFWKQSEILHIMTDTRSTFRNGNRDNYYRLKLTDEEMIKYWELLIERRK